MIKDFPVEIITGIEKIDLQHMEFVARIKMLHESYINGNNEEKLAETFHYMKCYIEEHFETEEFYMTKYKYPGFESHMQDHQDFADKYLELEKLFKKDNNSHDFNLDFNLQIINWLHSHILGEDMALADFIREKEEAALNTENELH